MSLWRLNDPGGAQSVGLRQGRIVFTVRRLREGTQYSHQPTERGAVSVILACYFGLNLLVTAIILWNTRYLERAVAALRQTETVPDHLLAHLSPLG
jgi:hypothetical protein